MANKSRHEFKEATKEVLAKRVGYNCSNPSCKSATVGPGGTSDSFVKIGIAAHITAAAPKGPRFDPNLSKADRISIENGIWLCSNCSILIDRDPISYPTSLLLKWKSDSEKEALQKIQGIKSPSGKPRIQPDLIWSHSIRKNHGFSEKNREKFGEGPYFVGLPLVIHWGITSDFTLNVFNNSTSPAFNIKIESDIPRLRIDTLPKVNNLPPYEKIELVVSYEQFLEGNHMEADEILKPLVPDNLLGKTILFSFENESGHCFSSTYEFFNKGLRLIK